MSRTYIMHMVVCQCPVGSADGMCRERVCWRINLHQERNWHVVYLPSWDGRWPLWHAWEFYYIYFFSSLPDQSQNEGSSLASTINIVSLKKQRCIYFHWKCCCIYIERHYLEILITELCCNTLFGYINYIILLQVYCCNALC